MGDACQRRVRKTPRSGGQADHHPHLPDPCATAVGPQPDPARPSGDALVENWALPSKRDQPRRDLGGWCLKGRKKMSALRTEGLRGSAPWSTQMAGLSKGNGAGCKRFRWTASALVHVSEVCSPRGGGGGIAFLINKTHAAKSLQMQATRFSKRP